MGIKGSEMTLLIRPENAADRDAIREVNQLALGDDAEANPVEHEESQHGRSPTSFSIPLLN